MKRLNIAIMGIRGIPACYGGFETLAEELAPRLVQKGHAVTVYGRTNIINYREKYYKRVRIRLLPTISHKYFDTIVHTFLSIIDSFFRRYHVILICNAANSLFAFLPRLIGTKVVVNVDGIERKRKKWGALGRLWYCLGEIFSVIFPNQIVSDALVIKDYYKKTYGKDSVFIPYGTALEKTESTEILEKFCLKPREYFLYVSRLEPENNAHIVIKAFEQVETSKKLVIVGDAPYAKNYIYQLKKTNDPRIIFTGFVFGQGYRELQSHAFCYIHATEVGGTHPALIEAMGVGNCVVANGTPENMEVLGEAGLVYEKNNVNHLREILQSLEDNRKLTEEYGILAQRRATSIYDWEIIADKYNFLFLDVTRSL